MPKKVKPKAVIEIKPDMRVSLQIRLKDDADGMKQTVSLNSVIEDVLEDGCLLIHMPIYQGYHYPLPRDNPMSMRFFVHSQMFAVSVQFEERIRRDGFQYAKLRRFGEIEKHQQRDCFRFTCALPITVERFWQHERNRYPDRQPSEGQMVNFSDGGMLFATNEEIEKGDKLTITFEMGTVEGIEGIAVRTEMPTDGQYTRRVGMAFRHNDKDKTQKRRFYKYVTELQLEERRRQAQEQDALSMQG